MTYEFVMKLFNQYTGMILLAIGVVFTCTHGITYGLEGAGAKKPMIKMGDRFPGILFPVPPAEEDLDYLGLTGKQTFSISDVAAEVLLVEVMNINCGSCQQQAPVNNYLYSLIQSTPEATGRIKMMAISAGTLYRDIQDFKEYFKTPYPVIEDPDFVLYEAVGRTPTPFAIALVRDNEGKLGLVAQTHKGTQSNYKKTLEELQALLSEKATVIEQAGKAVEDTWVHTQPVLTEEEWAQQIEAAFKKEGGALSGFRRIEIQSVGPVYTGVVIQGEEETRLFALPVSSPVPCDVCHDVHFFYVFDASGRIVSFVPVQLTKYGNDPLNAEDIQRLRERIEGRYLFQRFDYDLKVDAVSAATITSSVVYKNIQDGRMVYEALVKEGLIKK